MRKFHDCCCTCVALGPSWIRTPDTILRHLVSQGVSEHWYSIHAIKLKYIVPVCLWESTPVLKIGMLWIWVGFMFWFSLLFGVWLLSWSRRGNTKERVVDVKERRSNIFQSHGNILKIHVGWRNAGQGYWVRSWLTMSHTNLVCTYGWVAIRANRQQNLFLKKWNNYAYKRKCRIKLYIIRAFSNWNLDGSCRRRE